MTDHGQKPKSCPSEADLTKYFNEKFEKMVESGTLQNTKEYRTAHLANNVVVAAFGSESDSD